MRVFLTVLVISNESLVLSLLVVFVVMEISQCPGKVPCKFLYMYISWFIMPDCMPLCKSSFDKCSVVEHQSV